VRHKRKCHKTRDAELTECVGWGTQSETKRKCRRMRDTELRECVRWGIQSETQDEKKMSQDEGHRVN